MGWFSRIFGRSEQVVQPVVTQGFTPDVTPTIRRIEIVVPRIWLPVSDLEMCGEGEYAVTTIGYRPEIMN